MEQNETVQQDEAVFEFLPKETRFEHYELLVLIAGSQTEEEVNLITKTITDQIVAFDGKVTHEESLGRRNLAYTVAGQRSGVYTVLEFDLPTTLLPQLNEKLRIRKDVTRFLMVKKRVKSAEELAEEERVRQKIEGRRKAKMAAQEQEVEPVVEKKKPARRKPHFAEAVVAVEATNTVEQPTETVVEQPAAPQNFDKEIEKLLSDDIEV